MSKEDATAILEHRRKKDRERARKYRKKLQAAVKKLAKAINK